MYRNIFSSSFSHPNFILSSFAVFLFFEAFIRGIPDLLLLEFPQYFFVKYHSRELNYSKNQKKSKPNLS